MFKRIKQFITGDYDEEDEEIDYLEEFVQLTQFQLYNEASKPYDQQDHEKIQSLMYRLQQAKELAPQPPVAEEKKPFVSGDTLVKVGGAAGLALMGYHAEQTGHLLPKPFQIGSTSTMLKM